MENVSKIASNFRISLKYLCLSLTIIFVSSCKVINFDTTHPAIGKTQSDLPHKFLGIWEIEKNKLWSIEKQSNKLYSIYQLEIIPKDSITAVLSSIDESLTYIQSDKDYLIYENDTLKARITEFNNSSYIRREIPGVTLNFKNKTVTEHNQSIKFELIHYGNSYYLNLKDKGSNWNIIEFSFKNKNRTITFRSLDGTKNKNQYYAFGNFEIINRRMEAGLFGGKVEEYDLLSHASDEAFFELFNDRNLVKPEHYEIQESNTGTWLRLYHYYYETSEIFRNIIYFVMFILAIVMLGAFTRTIKLIFRKDW